MTAKPQDAPCIVCGLREHAIAHDANYQGHMGDGHAYVPEPAAPSPAAERMGEEEFERLAAKVHPDVDEHNADALCLILYEARRAREAEATLERQVNVRYTKNDAEIARLKGEIETLKVTGTAYQRGYYAGEQKGAKSRSLIVNDREQMRLRADKAEADAAKLREILRAMFELVDSGYFVRDISRDGEPGWALRQIKPVQTLTEARTALAGEGK